MTDQAPQTISPLCLVAKMLDRPPALKQPLINVLLKIWGGILIFHAVLQRDDEGLLVIFC